MIYAQLGRTLAYLVLVSFLLAGCGGGGGGGDTIGGGATNPGNEAPALSTNQAVAGQVISVSHSSIQANDIVDVTFQTEDTQPAAADGDTTSTVIPGKGIAVADGEVDVAVPTFFASDGTPVARDVRVYINGIPSDTILRVETLPDIAVATQGAVLEAVLQATIDHYENVLDNLDNVAAQVGNTVDPSDARLAIEEQIFDLQDQLDELQFLHQHTIVVDGISRTLTAGELEQVDRQLLLVLVSMDVAADAATGNLPALPVAADHIGTAQHLRDAWERAKAALEQEAATSGNVREGVRDSVLNGIPDTLQKGFDAFKAGVTYLGGFMSIMTSGAGALGGKALGIAASAYNIANAQFTSAMSMFNAWLADENTDAFLGEEGQGFSAGQEALSQLVRVATAYLGGLQSKLGKIFGAINTGLSVKDMLTEAKVDLCELFGSPSFCSDDDNEPASSFTILAYVNFDGERGTATQDNPSLNPQDADIKLSGNPGFPIISWPGDAFAVVASDASTVGLTYGIVSARDPDTNDLLPFFPPVQYGDYSIPNTEIASGALGNSPALQSGRFYEITVQRSDFTSAIIAFQVN